jgi:L-alanine-DL-glutamate epimerase-like enolase superfamily enzyme
LKDRVASIEATTVSVPLNEVLRLGDMTIADRRYAVVRVHTDEGLVGSAYALTRDTPVAIAVRDVIAPLVIGEDADQVHLLWERCTRGTSAGGRSGTVVRALSLVDIALWDIKAQRAGLPLWRLLGGLRGSVPVMVVGLYPDAAADPAESADQIVSYAEQGYELVKMARSPVPALTAAIIGQVATGLPAGARLTVDAAWCWKNPAQALGEMRGWPDAPIAWVEDPILPENVRACAALHEGARMPIAFGDEVTDPNVLCGLIEANATDVLRIDATTIGGITAAARVAAVADQASVPVSLHVYPELHVHLAAAWRSCEVIETFDPAGNPFDPAYRLFAGGPEIAAGVAQAPERAGLGIDLDLEFLEHHREQSEPALTSNA